jgi:hypothetical protein
VQRLSPTNPTQRSRPCTHKKALAPTTQDQDRDGERTSLVSADAPNPTHAVRRTNKHVRTSTSTSQTPRTMSNTTPEMSTPRAASWRTTYLTAYNTLQTSLWFILLTLTLSALSLGPDFIYTQIGPFARWVQTLCLLDIAHAATGLIPSPLGTTFTQVATRVIQVWLIWWGFPEAVLGSTSGGVAFVALVLAWSLADGVRYAFLVVKMVYGSAGETLTWLRYVRVLKETCLVLTVTDTPFSTSSTLLVSRQSGGSCTALWGLWVRSARCCRLCFTSCSRFTSLVSSSAIVDIES